jgi:glycosyltransferase involved in cell wall biosynthesis
MDCAPVSLVVPMRNEEASLGLLIASIQSQTCPPEEVLLVDGGSTDSTVLVARQLTGGDPRFRILEAGEATPGRGRNVGIAAASHDWIALTDAGIQLEPEWLDALFRAAEEDPTVQVVYGNYEPIRSSFYERCAALAYVSPKRETRVGPIRGPFIASSLLQRAVWEAAEGFPDLRAAEDLIFMETIESAGFKTGWAPSATVWWKLQPTLGRTFRKFVLYSRHNVWAGRQHDWHYGIARKYLFALPFVGLTLFQSPLWMGVPLVGGLARVARSIWTRREGRGILWLLNPVQFLGVATIVAAIDLATFVGWAQAVWRRSHRLRPISAAQAQRQP